MSMMNAAPSLLIYRTYDWYLTLTVTQTYKQELRYTYSVAHVYWTWLTQPCTHTIYYQPQRTRTVTDCFAAKAPQ